MSIFITTTSVFVDDQQKALDFYTGVLGFTLKNDVPVGDHRWLTVVGSTNDVELLLEPNEHPAARAYQAALSEDGIPVASFGVDDIAAEHERLSGLGVVFVQPPTNVGPVTIATLDDTCGNLIQIAMMS
jgi:catechol 2,3-dioxygenase-like lactoylglutathione lyase family enzyme